MDEEIVNLVKVPKGLVTLEQAILEALEKKKKKEAGPVTSESLNPVQLDLFKAD